MSNVPPTSQPTIAQVNQWLSELSAKQRLSLRFKLVEGQNQTVAGDKMGISQSTFSGHYNDALESLNNKAKKAGCSFPLKEALITASLKAMPKATDEEQILTEVALKGIQTATQKQPPPLPPQPRNRRLLVGLILGIVLTLGLLAALGALRNLFTSPASPVPSTPGPTQTARVATQEVTVEVPKTVVVQATVSMPQTVVVIQTSVVFVTQLVPVTQIVVWTPIPGPVALTTQVPPTVTLNATIIASAPNVTTTASVITDYGVPLPFIDNFTDGWRKEWQIVDGAPVINETGIRNSGPNLTLVLGNENLQDYTVEFTVTNRDFVVLFGPNIRYHEFFDNHSNVYNDVCNYDIQQNSQWELKAGASKCTFGGRVKFIVKGNTYMVYKNGQQFSRTIFEVNEHRGPFSIVLAGGIVMSNFKLTVP